MKRVALFAVIIALVGANCASHFEDSELLSVLGSQRAELDELVQMMQEDQHLRIVNSKYIYTNDWFDWPREELGISEGRWQEYKSLLGKVGAFGVSRRADLSGVILIQFSARGNVGGGSIKGLAYVPRGEQERLAMSEDLDSPQPQPNTTYFRSADDEWYLFRSQE